MLQRSILRSPPADASSIADLCGNQMPDGIVVMGWLPIGAVDARVLTNVTVVLRKNPFVDNVVR